MRKSEHFLIRTRSKFVILLEIDTTMTQFPSVRLSRNFGLAGAILAAASFCPSSVYASKLLDVAPLTNRILVLHFDDGFVTYHRAGQPRTADTVTTDPLDVAKASLPASYRISSKTDSNYSSPAQPTWIGRKSKGTKFAWMVQNWVDGHTVNTDPDHTKEHWVYLYLPQPLQNGKSYSITTGSLAKNGTNFTLGFNDLGIASEAVHTNLLGYAPNSGQKFAYVFHWMGDRGGLDLSNYAGKQFRVVDAFKGTVYLRGTLKLRKRADNPETAWTGDTPNGNFLGADVFECDFSTLTRPGSYLISVEGIGTSRPFQIDADVYRSAFVTTTRGLFHNRSGIELASKYTDFPRKAPHNPQLTPGFAGKLQYTSVRNQEWGSEGGDATALTAGIKGSLDSAGWYQDAGDWDSYPTHLKVPAMLLFTYEMAPKNFVDGELKIPESGNGLPDILDEAAYLPRFCYRLRHELLLKKYGTGGIGLRIAGDAFGNDTGPGDVGQGSWQDVNRTWVASGEDPLSTFGYAGVAAHLAYALKLAGRPDPSGVDWLKEAKESYAWALSNTRSGDENDLRNYRAYAAAGLFRLTGVADYEAQFRADTSGVNAYSSFGDDDGYAPYIYALGGGVAKYDFATRARMKAAVYNSADFRALMPIERRALRWGGNWYFPMLIGQQTTPMVLDTAVAATIASRDGISKASVYRNALYTTCDYMLGGNGLNTVWVSGLGPRNPVGILHLDAWYNGKGKVHPGVVPYGAFRNSSSGPAQGPWASDWAEQTVYPAGINNWPGHERWFDNRNCPITSEFTIHQTTGVAAAIYGFLCGPKAK